MTDTLNGINLERVAKLVSGHLPLDATRDEHDIAARVAKYGAELERGGYLPALRRQAMMKRMVELARRVFGTETLLQRTEREVRAEMEEQDGEE
jgi:heme oxygenase